MIDSVPDHVLLKLTEHQKPMDLLRLMILSRRLRRIGMASSVWARVRSAAMLPAPKPGARSLVTHFDVVMAKGCVACYKRRRGKFGFCADCKKTDPSFSRTCELVASQHRNIRWSKYWVRKHGRQLNRNLQKIEMAYDALHELESDMWALSGVKRFGPRCRVRA